MPDELPKIYLHIGRHKTGSTSIQDFLVRNSIHLKELDFRVVSRGDYSDLSPLTTVHPSPEANLFDLGNAIIRSDLLTGIRARGILPTIEVTEKRLFARRINERLKLFSESNLILSAEAFSFLRTQDEKDDLKYLFAGFEVKVLLIEREINAWIKSYKSQTRWMYKNHPELIDVAGTIFDFSPESWQVDLKELKWVFDDPTSLQYETLLKEDASVLPGFLKWLGLSPIEFASDLNLWSNKT